MFSGVFARAPSSGGIIKIKTSTLLVEAHLAGERSRSQYLRLSIAGRWRFFAKGVGPLRLLEVVPRPMLPSHVTRETVRYLAPAVVVSVLYDE